MTQLLDSPADQSDNPDREAKQAKGFLPEPELTAMRAALWADVYARTVAIDAIEYDGHTCARIADAAVESFDERFKAAAAPQVFDYRDVPSYRGHSG